MLRLIREFFAPKKAANDVVDPEIAVRTDVALTVPGMY